MNAILSIKPQFIEEIVAGKKKFEYRKSVFKQPVEKVYVYASAPISKVIGEFQPVDVVTGAPGDVWKETKQFSGITKNLFDEYYKGRKTAYAFVIQNFVKYDCPVNLPEGMHAPQSYCYVESL
jgi:predicted transcriptional regulator